MISHVLSSVSYVRNGPFAHPVADACWIFRANAVFVELVSDEMIFFLVLDRAVFIGFDSDLLWWFLQT